MARSLFARRPPATQAAVAGASTVREPGEGRFDALIARTLWGVAARLPVATASALGAGLLERLGPRLPKQRHVLGNLRHALPDADETHLRAAARACWRNAGAVLAEYPHLRRIADERMELVVDPAVATLLEQPGPRVFVSGHLGNWELAGAQLARFGLPVTGVYGRLREPTLDRLLLDFRRQLGCRMVEKRASARELVAALGRGEAVGLVADLRVDEGEMLPFFGVPARTSITPARLALRFSAPLIPIHVQRLPQARFRIRIHPPIPVPDAPDARQAARVMTRGFLELVERWIREDPGSWMCTKRRWPKRRPGSDASGASPS